MTTVHDSVPMCRDGCEGEGLFCARGAFSRGHMLGSLFADTGSKQECWEASLQGKTGHTVRAMLRRLDLIQKTGNVLQKLWFRQSNLTAVSRRDQRGANWRWEIHLLLTQI